jgi:energy-coupling factor transporter ATP-binding protein EcfA2
MSEQGLKSVLEALEADGNLSEDARAILIAALFSLDRLPDALAAIPGASVSDYFIDEDSATAAGGEVYLTRVSVCGFRGIAARVRLDLVPTPGLVLITGRNGSGKSSIAEAAELALSGTTNRASSTLWREGLHNLHHDGSAEVEIGLRIDGAGEVTVACTFDGDELTNLRTTVCRGDEQCDLPAHGWDDAVSRYRPVLTYGELSALASTKRSELFDPINKIVGLDTLTVADKRLTQAATEQNRVIRDATARRKTLLTALKASEDPRAAQLYSLFQAKVPDLDAAQAVVAGVAGGASVNRQTLAAWAALAGPDEEQARRAVDALTDALDGADRASAGAAGRAKRLADLLEMAITHRDHDDIPCPVCGQGQLDASWLAEAHQKVAEARQQAADADHANISLIAARAGARKLLAQMPTVLTQPAIDQIDPAPAAGAWTALLQLEASATEAERDRAVVTDLLDAVCRVNIEVQKLAESARHSLATQDTAWQPLRDQAHDTLRLMKDALVAEARTKIIGDARGWLRTVTETLRRERVARFANEATTIWEGLRQDSNVMLEDITLTGTNTRREVHLDLTVDGTPGPHAVLSQGELAALGLALFLPRSASDDSPFRFVIIDDPVQSMDPSKVDGLARVLHGLAKKRQVIVFTHDDRLLQAVRRLALPATAYMIDRGERSAVTVRKISDPVDQYLRDADALAKDTVLPADLLAIAVSGYCRDALDETAIEVARRRALAGGATVADTDKALTAASTTRAKLALALLGDSRKNGGQLDKALARLGPTARDVVTASVEGVHEPDPARVQSLLKDTRDVVGALRGVT